MSFRGASLIVLENPRSCPNQAMAIQSMYFDLLMELNNCAHKIIDFQPSTMQTVPLERLCECLFIDAVYRYDEILMCRH
jgi:hypothetical protein